MRTLFAEISSLAVHSITISELVTLDLNCRKQRHETQGRISYPYFTIHHHPTLQMLLAPFHPSCCREREWNVVWVDNAWIAECEGSKTFKIMLDVVFERAGNKSFCRKWKFVNLERRWVIVAIGGKTFGGANLDL